MNTSKHRLLVLIALLIVVNLVIIGCSITAEKPAQPMLPTTPIPPQNASPTPMAKSPLNPASPMEAANQAVTEARKVMGVNGASAFVADKIIYIGLDLRENSDKHQSVVIEKNVMNSIISLNSGYTAKVTSDMDTVKLIKTVAQGIAQGRSISNFKNEVNDITIKMTPKGSRLLNL